MEPSRPLFPRWLQRLDEDWLTRRPVTWSTRMLAVSWLAGLITLGLVVLGLLLPFDPKSEPRTGTVVTLLSVLSFLGLIIWLNYLLRFNVFKRFGPWQRTDTLKTFLLYFLSAGLILIWPFLPPVLQSWKARMQYTPEQLARDINTLNLRVCQLERDSLDTRFTADTFELKPGVHFQEPVTVMGPDSLLISLDSRYYISDSALREKRKTADSLKQVSATVFVEFSCPDFRFVSNYQVAQDSRVPVLTPMQLYRAAIQGRPSFDRTAAQKELRALVEKYRNEDFYGDGPVLSYGIVMPEGSTRTYSISSRWKLGMVNASINNIAERYYRLDRASMDSRLSTFYYFTLVISLLVLIYRHTTTRTFFWSWLAGILLVIFTGLMLAGSMGGEQAVYTFILVYYLLFMAGTLLTPAGGPRSALSGICINISALMTPFIPLVLTALVYANLHDGYSVHTSKRSYEAIFGNESFHYFLAEMAGFFLLLILLMTLFRRAWMRWYAAPEQ